MITNMSSMVSALKELYKTYWYERLRGSMTGLAHIVYCPGWSLASTKNRALGLDTLLIRSVRNVVGDEEGEQLVDAFPEATLWNTAMTNAIQAAIKEQA